VAAPSKTFNILPSCGILPDMLKNVAAVALPGVHAFELGVVCEVFGLDRSDQGCPVYDFDVVGLEAGHIPTSNNFGLTTEFGLERLAGADLICLPAAAQQDMDEPCPPALREALRAAADRGAWLMSVCAGVYTLGAAGLLDGRSCAAHWRYVDDVARRFPLADVQPDVLYVEDRGVITSAGTAAGIDACLYLVRREHGTKVANTIARRMVVPPHREGGQAQYVDRPFTTPGECQLQQTMLWMEKHLDRDMSVEEMAENALMSPRTFARRFQQETGTTPFDWLTAQRVLLAQELLEETTLGVDVIAARAGFGSAATLRHHFVKRRGTTPQAYRRTFRDPGIAA
jgi:transcriptional regulator GlxA family with amidase domain